MGDEDSENTIRRDARHSPRYSDDESIADTIISSRHGGAMSAGDDDETLIRARPALIPPRQAAAAPEVDEKRRSVHPQHAAGASSRTASSGEHRGDGSDDDGREHIARYRLSVNGGPALTLDTHVLIGRRPREPRVPAGAGSRLVTVASPRHEVSGTHIDVHQHGTSVIVTDMRSTNGTIVIMPGQSPVRLRPGDSLVAVPGTVVDIGDGNSIEILTLPRIRFADSSASERLSQ